MGRGARSHSQWDTWAVTARRGKTCAKTQPGSGERGSGLRRSKTHRSNEPKGPSYPDWLRFGYFSAIEARGMGTATGRAGFCRSGPRRQCQTGSTALPHPPSPRARPTVGLIPAAASSPLTPALFVLSLRRPVDKQRWFCPELGQHPPVAAARGKQSRASSKAGGNTPAPAPR